MFPLNSKVPYIYDDGTRATLGDVLNQESGDTSDLESRMTTAEDDIDSLESRMTTAEDYIDSLESRMTTAEDDIDSLESDVSDLSDAISDAYDDTATYAVGDYFIYEDTIYEVITACTGITPPNAEYYTAHNVTDLITTLNSSLNEFETEIASHITPIPCQVYDCSVGNGQISTTTLNSGVVFYVPYGTKSITFTITEISGRCQYGDASFGSTMPTIVSAGTGRGSYTQKDSAGTYTYSFSGIAGLFFVALEYGSLKITDIYCSEFY